MTPNSFSDGGKLQNPIKTFKEHSQSFDIVDVGAESTAPFNGPIGPGEELTRLVGFFSEVLGEKDPETTISIDSYRPEVFYEVALEVKKAWPKSDLIFNDVSGKVDPDLMELMKTELPFSYVFSHFRSPIIGCLSARCPACCLPCLPCWPVCNLPLLISSDFCVVS